VGGTGVLQPDADSHGKTCAMIAILSHNAP
jgi:hypothetical protein